MSALAIHVLEGHVMTTSITSPAPVGMDGAEHFAIQVSALNFVSYIVFIFSHLKVFDDKISAFVFRKL